MQKYTDIVQDTRGNAISGATVTIKDSPGGATSTTYAADAIGTNTNPLTTDGDGRYTFYAKDGSYYAAVSKSGITAENGPVFTLKDQSGWVSVKGFGATGDGVTDDMAAIQAAITANYGKSLYIPSGTYKISAQLSITDNIKIYGDGFDSVLKVDSAATRFIPILIYNVAGLTGVVLEDFAVDGSLKCTLDAGMIQINSAVAFVCSRLRVFNGGTPAESGSSGVNGIAVSAGSLGGVASQGVIENCLIEATTKAGLNWTTEAINGQLIGNIVRNCTGNGSTPGIQLNGGFNCRIIGNSCYGNQGSGIYIASSGGVGTERSPKHGIIAFNHCYSNTKHGIEWANGVTVYYGRLIIEGNQLYSNGAAGTGAGMTIQNDTHAIVANNYAYNNNQSGFIFGGGSTTQTDLHITGNVSEANNQTAASTGGGYYFNGTFTRVEFINNKSVDTQGSPTHKYGLVLDANVVMADWYVRGFKSFGSVNKPQVLINQAASISNIDVVYPWDLQTTTGATSNTATFLLPDNTAWRYRIKIVAKKDDASDRALYEKETLVYRDGGGATRQGAEIVYASIESNAAWDVSTLVTGNLVYSQYTGAAATNIDWVGEVEVRSL